MTRQEAVIKIAKITRIIGELKYQLDADDEVEFEALDPEWKHIAEWTQEVCRYMELDASPQVARLIANIGFTDMVEKYVQSRRKEIGAKEAKILDDYVKHMRTLSSLCDTRSEEQREKYGDLKHTLFNAHGSHPSSENVSDTQRPHMPAAGICFPSDGAPSGGRRPLPSVHKGCPRRSSLSFHIPGNPGA